MTAGEKVKAAPESPGSAVTASAVADAAPGRRPWWQFICTPAQSASGQAYWVYTPGRLPPHAQVLLRFSGMAVVPVSP